MVLTYQAERMPEQIRLKVGGATPQQMAVYEEFAHNIPGFLPITERDAATFVPKSAAVICLNNISLLSVNINDNIKQCCT